MKHVSKLTIILTLLLTLILPTQQMIQASELKFPLTGLPSQSEAEVSRRPLAVMIDNHPAARFQAGLSQADVIYEYQVEGSYTRYMAVFQSQQPEAIGPIRSARPYFVETASDLGAIYTHFGGSKEGLDKITELNVNNISGMEVPSSTIWRNNSTGKVAPHNAYASDKSLREYGQSLKYTLESQPELKLFEFTSEFTDVHGNAATAITIAFNNDNVSQFNYDTATKTYKYTKDGYHQIDEHTQTDIAPTNVIVHTMDFKPINSEKGTYTLQQTGEGTAHYFTGGQQVSIKWKKIEGLPYQYFTEDDKPLKLNPGMTWIAFGKPDTQISYQ